VQRSLATPAILPSDSRLRPIAGPEYASPRLRSTDETGEMSGETIGVLAISVARQDVIGGVLVLLSLFFAVLGYFLSKEGLKATSAAEEVTSAVQKTQSVASDAQQTVASAQRSIAQETGVPPEKVAASSESVAASTSAIQDQISAVNDALSGLTGNQAPARVAWSFSALCLVAALVSFDLISLDVSSGAD
jgi:hypothetical protein